MSLLCDWLLRTTSCPSVFRNLCGQLRFSPKRENQSQKTNSADPALERTSLRVVSHDASS